MSPKQPMPVRHVRVPSPLWEDAMVIADRRDESVSDVIRRALENYVRRNR